MKTLFCSRRGAAVTSLLIVVPWLGFAQVLPPASGGGTSSTSKSTGTSSGTTRGTTSGTATGRSGSATGKTTTNTNNLGSQNNTAAQQQPSTTVQPGGGQNLNQGQLSGGTQQPGTVQNPSSTPQSNTPVGQSTTTNTQRSDSVNSQNQNRNAQTQRPGTSSPGVSRQSTTTAQGNINPTPGTVPQTTTTDGQQTTTTNTQSRNIGPSGTSTNQTAPSNLGASTTEAALSVNAGVAAGVGPSFQGTIADLTGTGFTFASPINGAPQTFLTTPDTVFVDSDNKPVARERFPSQLPATVFYKHTSDGTVATRVVASQKAAVFATGTLTEVSPGVMVMQLGNASDTPVRYVNDKTTNYVNQNGEPVPPESVTPGTPVKVFYTKIGDTLYASKVEVQTGASGLPRPPAATEDSGTTIKDPNVNR